MTLKQLRKILAKEIFPKLGPGYAYDADTLIYKADRTDIVRGFFFERSRVHETGVYVHCFVMPLMIETDTLSFNFGDRMRTSERDQVWEIMDGGSPGARAEMIQAMEREPLPQQVVDSKDFVSRFSDIAGSVIHMEAFAYCSCSVDIRHHQTYLSKLVSDIEAGGMPYPWMVKIRDTALGMQQLSSDELRTTFDTTIANQWQRIERGWYRRPAAGNG